MFAPILIARL